MRGKRTRRRRNHVVQEDDRARLDELQHRVRDVRRRVAARVVGVDRPQDLLEAERARLRVDGRVVRPVRRTEERRAAAAGPPDGRLRARQLLRDAGRRVLGQVGMRPAVVRDRAERLLLADRRRAPRDVLAEHEEGRAGAVAAERADHALRRRPRPVVEGQRDVAPGLSAAAVDRVVAHGVAAGERGAPRQDGERDGERQSAGHPLNGRANRRRSGLRRASYPGQPKLVLGRIRTASARRLCSGSAIGSVATPGLSPPPDLSEAQGPEAAGICGDPSPLYCAGKNDAPALFSDPMV